MDTIITRLKLTLELSMSIRTESKSDNGRLERELERERHQRTLNDEARLRLGVSADLRTKDARESANSHDLTRRSRI
jgi:hypothetical protein